MLSVLLNKTFHSFTLRTICDFLFFYYYYLFILYMNEIDVKKIARLDADIRRFGAAPF